MFRGPLNARQARYFRRLGMHVSEPPMPHRETRDSVATVEARLRKSPKFLRQDGKPNEQKIAWFLNKLLSEGKIVP